MGIRDAHASNLRLKNPDNLRACVVRTAKSLEFVKERTNKNDHPKIFEIFREIGYPQLARPSSSWTARMWCMAYTTYCFRQCSVKVPIAGPAAVRSWKAARKYQLPRTAAILPADVAIFTWGSHGGIVVDAHPNPAFPFVNTYEGNTGAPRGATSTRQGVWPKQRLRREIATFIRII